METLGKYLHEPEAPAEAASQPIRPKTAEDFREIGRQRREALRENTVEALHGVGERIASFSGKAWNGLKRFYRGGVEIGKAGIDTAFAAPEILRSTQERARAGFDAVEDRADDVRIRAERRMDALGERFDDAGAWIGDRYDSMHESVARGVASLKARARSAKDGFFVRVSDAVDRFQTWRELREITKAEQARQEQMQELEASILQDIERAKALGVETTPDDSLLWRELQRLKGITKLQEQLGFKLGEVEPEEPPVGGEVEEKPFSEPTHEAGGFMPLRLPEPIAQAARVGLAALRLSGAGGILNERRAEAAGSTGKKTKASDVLKPASERITMKDAEVEKATERKWKFDIGGHVTFFKKSPDGKLEFKPDVLSVLFPAQVEITHHEATEKERAAFQIPQEYARLFDSAKALNPTDYEKVAVYIDGELQKHFADLLRGFDMNKRVYRERHGSEETKGLRVESITVTGTASPEGPQQKGAGTIVRDAIDNENIELAKLRGTEAARVVKERLAAQLGVSPEQLAALEQSIGAEELQFSGNERNELIALGGGTIEGTFRLIVDYNDNKVTDAKTITALDRLLGSKRSAEVTIELEGNRKETLLIPIPLLLALPLAWPALRRIRRRLQRPAETSSEGGQRPGEELRPVPESGLESEPVPEPVPLPVIPQEVTSEKIPPITVSEIVRTTPLPERGSTQYASMWREIWVNDIDRYFDDPEIFEIGAAAGKNVDYRTNADKLFARYDEFSNREQRELFLTGEILESWRIIDQEKRRRAGVSEGELAKGLDYDNQPQQVRWARMHARALMQLVRAKRMAERAGKNPDYLAFIYPQVRDLTHEKKFARSGVAAAV